MILALTRQNIADIHDIAKLRFQFGRTRIVIIEFLTVINYGFRNFTVTDILRNSIAAANNGVGRAIDHRKKEVIQRTDIGGAEKAYVINDLHIAVQEANPCSYHIVKIIDVNDRNILLLYEPFYL